MDQLHNSFGPTFKVFHCVVNQTISNYPSNYLKTNKRTVMLAKLTNICTYPTGFWTDSAR